MFSKLPERETRSYTNQLKIQRHSNKHRNPKIPGKRDHYTETSDTQMEEMESDDLQQVTKCYLTTL
jgi:hypothetical protein